jgi:outer membrane immunogenic protein
MRLPLVGLAVAALSATPTLATASEYRWTGWYVGANAGYAWGKSDFASNFYCTGQQSKCPWASAFEAIFSAGTSGSRSDTGFTGGMQTGYNWQDGQLLYGVETDFGAFDLNPTLTTTAPFTNSGRLIYSTRAETSADWFWTLRGRVGWTVVPDWLIYATGGLAVTELKIANSYQDNASASLPGSPDFAGASRSKNIKAGFTVGGGVEAALDQSWSVRAEYLYVDFGSADTTLTTNARPGGGGGSTPHAMTTSGDLSASVARIGINYRLD